MARLPPFNIQTPDITLVNLNRLLARLDDIIPDVEQAGSSPLRKSSLERSRVGANLEYARTLLLRLERDSTAPLKKTAKKQTVQSEFSRERSSIKRLSERLYKLSQLDNDEDSSDDGDEADEDLLREDDGDAQEHISSLHQRGQSSSCDVGSDNKEPLPTVISSSDNQQNERSPEAALSMQGTESMQQPSTLRSRRTAHTSNDDVGISTSSHTKGALANTEALLSHNRTEQEDLSTSLLNMAQALKQSSQAFAASLESEKDVVDRAGEGLEKNSSGMQAAEQRMGTLRRMTEGKGWLGRMLLYAWIAGLMMLALFIVGFLPKLRF
ncbi:MAG: hypothetical protein M1825_002697 [Sarcosagium campestre]|nr:MAG: hypothetical protein M1825_002697 [Sarcosagium campestre]